MPERESMSSMRKIYFILNKGSNGISRLLEVIIVLLVCACGGSVFLQVINRYIIVKLTDVSLSFTDELSRWLMVNITYLTIGLCLREGSMAQVDLIFCRLGKNGRLLLYLTTRLLMALVLFTGVWFGLYVMRMKAGITSSMLSIPGRILYAPPVIGSVLMSYEWLTELFGVLSGELVPFAAGSKRGFPSHEEPPEEFGAL
jgi:TRAP-type C4-dicarboxylate transport system permease small subunit